MKLKKTVFIASIAFTLFILFGLLTYACTDIMVGKLASTDGSVITSHTVDGRYDSRIIIVPAADHEAGTMAPVYENIVYADHIPLVKLGEIPQVAHTYKYFNGAYPYANEHQVIIGEIPKYRSNSSLGAILPMLENPTKSPSRNIFTRPASN